MVSVYVMPIPCRLCKFPKLPLLQPLDGLNEESLDSAYIYQQTPAVVTKYNVPCRFFLNGYCNKGESCFFLHGPSDYDSRVSMEFSAVMDKPAIDRKITVRNGISSDAPVPTNASHAVTYSPATDKVIATEGDTRSAIPIAIHANPSANITRTSLNAKIAMGNDTRQSRMNPPLLSRVFTRTFQAEQRSGDQVNEDAEMEDWGSSPGNDIPSIHVNTKPSSARGQNMQTRITSGSMDLRQVLIKRRRLSNDQDYFSGTFRSSQNVKRYQQTGLRYLQGRLASKLAISNGVRSQIVRGSFRKSSFRQKRPWHSRTGKASRHSTGRWGKQSFKARKSKSFEGFFEIREPSTGTAEDDFERPRTLCEILKEKRMPKSEVSVIIS